MTSSGRSRVPRKARTESIITNSDALKLSPSCGPTGAPPSSWGASYACRWPLFSGPASSYIENWWSGKRKGVLAHSSTDRLGLILRNGPRGRARVGLTSHQDSRDLFLRFVCAVDSTEDLHVERGIRRTVLRQSVEEADTSREDVVTRLGDLYRIVRLYIEVFWTWSHSVESDPL